MNLLLLLLFLFLPSSASSALELKNSMWSREAAPYGLDPYLLYAFALVESGRYVGNGNVRPWPWTLGVPGKPFYMATRAEAESKLAELLAAGQKNIGVGLMQVNVKYHGDKVADPRDLLDPVINVRLGARILFKALMRHPGDPLLGLGAYYSSDPHKAYPYARRVLAIARMLHQIENDGGDHRVLAER